MSTPQRIYFIGNSVTDTINLTGLQSFAANQTPNFRWGRHMIPGAPLSWIWDHPDSGFKADPYGYYPTALTQYSWDGLSLQPFDRPLDGADGDLTVATRFINLAKPQSPNLQVYVYQRWPRKPQANPSAQDWNDLWLTPYTGSYTQNETRGYFVALTAAIRDAHPDLPPPIMVPVGDVMYALNAKMQRGEVPGYSSIWQLYTDNIHLNTVGSYLVGATYYATLYQTNPSQVAIPAEYGRLDPALAAVLQQTVWEVVSTSSIPVPTAPAPNPATPTLILADATTLEGQDREAEITVSLSQPSAQPVTVRYSTANGSAQAGSDYRRVSGQLTWAPGETSQTIRVPILTDSQPEVDETFTLTFSEVQNATLPQNQAVVTITDTLESVVSTVLPEGIRNLTLIGSDPINGTGNLGNNTIRGNAAANILDGKVGYDTLIGGNGDDTYRIEGSWWDVVVERPNQGQDTVRTQDSYTLADHLEDLVLLGTSDISGTGNALNNGIVGNSGTNLLDGQAGDDRLDGQAGADRLQGGPGDDLYIVDSINDVVVEQPGGGTDTIRTSIPNYPLPAHVERIERIERIESSQPLSQPLPAAALPVARWQTSAQLDILQAGAAADRFLYSGVSRRQALAKSRLRSIDRLLNFDPQQGDRIQLNFDRNLDTADLPRGLFDAGRQPRRSLLKAAQSAYADKVPQTRGDQPLRLNEAVLFGWRGQEYLSLNIDSRGFQARQDWIVQLVDRVPFSRPTPLGVSDFFI